MDDNTFWILIWLLITPFGWLGLVFSGIASAMVGYGIGCIFQGIRGKLE